MAKLRLPVMFFGPASYNVAPVELIFGLLKAVNLNPEGLGTSKQFFAKVAHLILNRLADIAPPVCVLLWHHCLQHCARYLVFTPL